MSQKFSSSRQKITKLMSSTNGLITIDDAQRIFQISRQKARQILLSLAKSGWLKMIKSGLYAPVPLETADTTLSEESPYIVANQLFSPCYMGGWTAANFWGFTDQLFIKTWVMTTKNVRRKIVKVTNHQFILRHISNSYNYGFASEWVQNNKILFSDPHKTLIDFANFTHEFGSMALIDIFHSYMKSEHIDLNHVKIYAQASGNKTIFKRLGFLMETYYPHEKDFINFCSLHISKGYSSFSSTSSCNRIIRRWKLKIPLLLENQKYD